MSETFFIADTHFGHNNIIKYENRPFSNTEEMDKFMVEQWNSVVSQMDKIFVVGDFAIAKAEDIKAYVSALNGYKILVMGNHDEVYSNKDWLDFGFDEVSSYPIIFNDWYILSHMPIYMNENMPYANIFGHVHSNPSYKPYSGQSFCVSAERLNYKPINYKDMIAKMQSY